MNAVFIILAGTLRLILRAFYVLLIIRAVMSWFPMMGGTFAETVYRLTEPVLAPVRRLFDRFGGSSFMPIDWSFLAVMIVLTMLINIV